MTVKEWCALNRVAESSLYKWIARFREEDPDRFLRRSSEVSSWMKVTRRGIADAVAIVCFSQEKFLGIHGLSLSGLTA